MSTVRAQNPDRASFAASQAEPHLEFEADEHEDFGPTLSLRETRYILGDLFEHRPWIYWTDFLLTTTLGYGCTIAYFRSPWFTLQQATFFLIAGLAMFRTATFIHEIVHMRKGLMIGFRAAWNLLFGIPMLMPSLLYSNHIDHHKRHHYGTAADGEYQPFARRSPLALVYYFGQVLILPFLAIVRFLILAPASWVRPALRPWVLERFSSYGSNFRYRRELGKNEPLGLWTLMEVACFLNLLGLPIALATGFPPIRMLQIYLLALFTIGLNWLRNLAGHRFRNEGESLSALGQLKDSITITGHPLLTELLFPLGLRYHALHHLYPSLPYHNLGIAHRRLVEQLPANSLYHQTIHPSLWSVLKQLWLESRASSKASAVED